MSLNNSIIVRGARQHNLKGVDVSIPRDRLVVVTGLSGSGKSSLAFDTIYAEGQRRYVESLSAYARQFLEQMQKPDVDSIEGLPPTISIEQRTGHATPRSTVATSTEIYDYLRLLFARVGRPACYKCGRAISQQTPDQIVNAIYDGPAGSKIVILAPLVRGKKGSHKEVFDRVKREGFVRVRVDGAVQELKDVLALDKNKKHEIEAVVDRLVLDKNLTRRRLADSVETALKLGEGLVIVATDPGDKLFSEKYACPHCGVSFGELQPRLFSFNSPYGACETCDGLGTRLELDADLIVPDPKLSLRDGAIEPWKKLGKRMTIRYGRRLREFCEMFDVRYATPFEKIDSERRRLLLHGTKPEDEKRYGRWFEGVLPSLMHRFEVTESDFIKRRIMSYMSELPCPSCQGKRLRPEALSVRVGERNIDDVTRMTIEQAAAFFEELRLTKEERHVARMVLKEIRNRLKFLLDVGLGYLTLDRRSSTLAGGEAQRIRLASQVGSGLVGVCYVLDEPTIGLHERDNRRLLDTLVQLRDLGNTVVVVEHDEETIRSADHIIDVGPGAGLHGGEIVAQGRVEDIIAEKRSITGRFLSGEEMIPLPARRRHLKGGRAIEVIGAAENNLKKLNVRFPLGGFVCVTGVSGSGKSTLVGDILRKGLARIVGGSKEKPGAHESIKGHVYVDRVIEIDQSPIGRTPRSNPATYTGAWNEIRGVFSMTKEAKARGYWPGRFSFNLKGGRCEACEGQGTKVIEMHFLPDVYVVCEECKGKRYNQETLDVKYKGKDVSEILEMPIEQALEFFANFPKIHRVLKTMDDVGLGYMALGQSATTLSGGEAQRVKLAAELGKTASGHTLYILDEPTTGLHFADIKKLLGVLDRLVEQGNSVLVIEHNMHVIKTADWIIDLGPEGGERGGEIVVEGAPEEVAADARSYTGRHLKPYLLGSSVPPFARAAVQESTR
ncbi:MAG: excinuclease ABC subunit UvrA [Planctomycetes bacterium]|nr:excinuclease ABC subunit UvrA [Planctomycetota bacterium]